MCPSRGCRCSCPARSGRRRLGCAAATTSTRRTTSGEWLVLAGERGVGKTTLARCVHQRRHPTGRMRTLEATAERLASRRDNRGPRGRLGDPACRPPRPAGDGCVRRPAAGGPLPAGRAVDRDHPDQRAGELAELLAFFPRTVKMPPLRRHVEDLTELVPLFLSRLGPGGQMTCSPAAMHLLMRGMAGQRHPALPGSQTRRPPSPHRHHPPGRPAGRVPHGHPPAPQPTGVHRARRHRAEPGGRRGEQGHGGADPRYVPGDALPENPRIRHRHPRQVRPAVRGRGQVVTSSWRGEQ